MLRDGSSVVESSWCGTESSDSKLRCEQIHRTLKRIVRARAALDAREIAMLREANELRVWRAYGCSSLVDYMERELGYTARAAVERLRVAQVMAEVPALELALTQGDISFSGAREIARVATPETADEWIAATEGKNVRQIEEMVSGHQKGDLPSDPPDPKLVLKVLRFEVKAETYALMRQVEKQLENERGERLDHDALINALCRAILDGGGDRENAAYQVAATVCKQCKRGWQHGGGVIAEMTPAAVERALCDSQDIGSIDGVGTQRAKQAVPPAMRRKVKHRDQNRCRVPGCRSKHIDIHHIRPRSLGGTHTEDNLITLCEGHHLAMHEGSIVISGEFPNWALTRAPNHAFKRETLAVEAKAALRARGFEPHVVKSAIDAARTHVGRQDLTLAQWVEVALRFCPAEQQHSSTTAHRPRGDNAS